MNSVPAKYQDDIDVIKEMWQSFLVSDAGQEIPIGRKQSQWAQFNGWLAEQGLKRVRYAVWNRMMQV